MKSFVFLAAGMFVMGCDDYVVAGLLPGLSASLGTSMAGAAQGISAFGLTYVVCAPVFAVLLASKPARLVLLTALAIFAAGNVMTLLSTNLAAYLISRAIAGIGAGMYLPVAVAAAAELAAPDAKGRALGLVWGANSAGAVLGVPAGLWLADRVGWQATIGLIIALGAVCMVGIALRQPNLRVEAPPSLRQQCALMVDRRVLSVIGVTCLTAAASLGLYAFVAPLQAGMVHSSEATLSVWNVGGLIGSLAIGVVVDRTGHPRQVMVALLATLIVALMALPLVRSVPVLGLLPFLVWGAMGWATVTPQQHHLIELQPGHEATVVALNSSAVGLGSVFGPALGGLALACGLDVWNLPYAAIGLLLGALVWQVWLIQQQQRKEASA